MQAPRAAQCSIKVPCGETPTECSPQCVFFILLTHGRIPLPHLIQRSRLPSRCVKAGLAVLVQHHLVLYLIPSEDDPVTIYEANIRNAYNLLRFGKNGHILHNSLGEHTGHIAENLLLEGTVLRSHVRDLEYIESRGDSTKALPNGAGTCNAVTNGNNHITPHTFESSTNGTAGPRLGEDNAHDTLFSCGYILQCRRLDYMPEHDFDDMIQQHVLSNKYNGLLKGTEAKEDYAEDVRNMKRRILDGNRLENEIVSNDGSRKKKRKRGAEDSENGLQSTNQGKESAKSHKQRKLNGGTACNSDANTGAEAARDSQASVLEGAEASVSYLSYPLSYHD